MAILVNMSIDSLSPMNLLKKHGRGLKKQVKRRGFLNVD